MKLTEILCIAGTALIIASCSGSSTDPNPTPNGKDTLTHKDTLDTNTHKDTLTKDTIPHPPVHEKSYDTARGGVQIVAIYYDQSANKSAFGLANPEEWIVLRSDREVSLSGWHLDGGSGDGQRYPLSNTINGRLYIFTHDGNVPASITAGAATISLRISSSMWIWNNSDHDTATIYDASNRVVDKLSY